MRRRLSTFILLLTALTASAQVRLARLFTDHAVLQRQQPIPVWGWAKPGETVRATLAGQTQQAKADATGKWMVRFAPLEAGGPHTLSVTAKSGQASANDLLIGEVWLCSGQSNMEWSVRESADFLTEKKDANYPTIRHFRVEHELALTPQTNFSKGEWLLCSSETVGGFTGVGFFFARELSQKLNVPVGLLHSSWGGSMAEGWISREAMQTNAELGPTVQPMPTSWTQVDSLIDAKLRKKLLGGKQPTLADEATYLTANADINRWKQTSPLGQWDWKGMSGFRGQHYTARYVDVPAELVGTETYLGLAQNDSPNQIYVNGKWVSEGVVPGKRRIKLPAGTWQAGRNLLMIKAGDMVSLPWHGPGFMGSAADLYLEGAAGRVDLGGDWAIMPSFASTHHYTHFVNNLATGLYNGMIHPLLPYGIRGTLWYQGESNADRAYQYRQTFPLLINDWRQKWGRDFPFYFVQLSSYGGNPNSNEGSDWAELREAQTMTLSLPNTGMAVTTDIGNPTDIHPTNKQDVGHRLALVALKQTYNQPGSDGSPLFEQLKIEGQNAIVGFHNVPTGLMAKDRYGYLKGFEIAGSDKVFHYAQARIDGNRVIVAHPNVPAPVAVRYAWTDAPEDANLFSTEGLPASPFRTDDWPEVTRKIRFE